MIITYVVGTCGLNHVIAGSTNVFLLVASGHLSLVRRFTTSFVPTLTGNIIGGVSVVALAHGQVVGGKK